MGYREVIAALECRGCKPIRKGSGHRSRCPHHEGEGRSLEVTLLNGRVIARCWAADCRFEDIAAALGLSRREFFEDVARTPSPRVARAAAIGKSGGGRRRLPPGAVVGDHSEKGHKMGFDKPTLAQVARKTGTTTEHLRSLGWTEGEGEVEKRDGKTFRVTGCRVPYYVAANEGDEGAVKVGGVWVVEVFAKIRASFEGDPKYLHERLGEPGLYGEWLFDEFRQRERPEGVKGGWPYLWLVEGETDTASMLFHGQPCGGIPGVDLVRKVLQKRHVEGFEKILIVREPGEGGTKFCQNIAERLDELEWRGVARVVTLPEKDAGALSRRAQGSYLDELREASRGAVPLGSLGAREEVRKYLQTGAQVQMRPVRFVAYPWFPMGYLTLLVGEAGIGKSTLMAGVSAQLSRGEALECWDAERSEMGGGRTLVFRGEDRPDETLLPRYIAAGGDPEKIVIFDTTRHPVTFRDTDFLGEVVAEVKPALIMFDPLSRFWPEGVSMVNQEEVQPILTPLCDLGRRHDAALALVGWSPKNQSEKAIDMVFGSVAWRGSARSCLAVQRIDSELVISHVKCNVAPMGPSMTYELSPDLPEIDSGVWESLGWGAQEAIRRVGSFRWGRVIHETADELAAKANGKARGKSGGAAALVKAKELIEQTLRGKGDVPSSQLQAAYRAAGVSWSVWNAAQLDLGVRPVQDPEGGFWVRLDDGDELPDDDMPF